MKCSDFFHLIDIREENFPDNLQDESHVFTFYSTDEPIFLITIDEDIAMDNDIEGDDDSIMFNLESMSHENKYRNTWKMLYIALSQKYEPTIYFDEIDEIL
jgi:hypothetical protein